MAARAKGKTTKRTAVQKVRAAPKGGAKRPGKRVAARQVSRPRPPVPPVAAAPGPGQRVTVKQNYRCVRCGFIVTASPGEKAPAYCPNCAVTHLMGKMEPMTR